MLRRFWQSSRSVFLRCRFEREMQEEMALHLERSEARLKQRGLSANEARLVARREFGNVGYLQEEARDARGGRWVESLLADVRFGLRHFLRTPATTATMIVLLALGIGLNSALFTFLHSMATQPPPGIVRADDLVRIRGIGREAGYQDGTRGFSYPEFREYASQTTLFNRVAAWTSTYVTLGIGKTNATVNGGAATFVTANYFNVLGVRPILGTGMPMDIDDADATQPVAVISHAFWERYLGGASNVIGKTIKVNDVAFSIVGVAPRKFSGARPGASQIRVWVPLGTRPLVMGTGASTLSSYDSTVFSLVARLQPGVKPESAIPVVRSIAARAQAHSSRALLLSADVVTLLANNYYVPSGLEEPPPRGRYLQLVFPLLLLLVPCTNVSALLVGLAVARRREIAVRLSLGASRGRIIRQLITESVLLATAAGGLALLIIALLFDQFGDRAPDVQFVIHWPALLFTFGIALISGIGLGIAPSLHATRFGLSAVLKDSAAGVLSLRSRLQSAIVVAQIALTQPLLFMLGAAVLEFVTEARFIPTDPMGDRIVRVSFNTNERYGALGPQREAALRHLQARIAGLPGVESVVAEDLDGDYAEVRVHPQDMTNEIGDQAPIPLDLKSVRPGFFALRGYSLIVGREFTELENAQSIVIRRDLARRLFGNANPLGRRLASTASARTFTIVGVVDETHLGRLRESEGGFMPTSAHAVTSGLLVRTRGLAQPLIPVIQSITLQEAPSHPITNITTLAAEEARQRAQIRTRVAMVSSGAAVALLLSAIGLYAVGAFAVGQRTREIGIRTALGADPQRVARLFFWRGVRLSVVGLNIGVFLMWFLQRLLVISGSAPVPQTQWMTAGIAVLVVLVACAASWIPARRAARVDPLTALRVE